MKKTVNTEFSKSNPLALISLFEVDTSEIDGNRLPASSQVFYFHNSREDELSRSVYFGDPVIEYTPIPIEFVGGEMKGDGTQLPRPKLRIGNSDGIVSYYINRSGGMVGAKVTRKRVFSKYLHESTWGGTNPWGALHDADAELVSDVFFVESVASENKNYVEFELASIIDVQGVKIPRRRMYATNCSFEYRNGSGCGYSGVPVAGRDDVEFASVGSNQGLWNESTNYSVGDYVYLESSVQKEDGSGPKLFYFVCVEANSGYENRPISSDKWKIDACSLKINGCKLRFGDQMEGNGLPFGGFPSLQRVELE